MVKLPDTLLKEMKGSIGTSKTATYRQILNKFIMAGYCEKKAKKWIGAYFEIGVLERASEAVGEDTRVYCIWW